MRIHIFCLSFIVATVNALLSESPLQFTLTHDLMKDTLDSTGQDILQIFDKIKLKEMEIFDNSDTLKV